MKAPLRVVNDKLSAVDAIWLAWRESDGHPPMFYVASWQITRSNGGTIFVSFDSLIGWTLWARFLGLDSVTGPNEHNAHGFIDGVRIILTCPIQPGDEAGAA